MASSAVSQRAGASATSADILIYLFKIDAAPAIVRHRAVNPQRRTQMPRGETSNVADGLENVVAAETVLSKVDGEAGVLILRGHYLQDIAGRRSFEWLAGLLWQDFVQQPLAEDGLRRDLG